MHTPNKDKPKKIIEVGKFYFIHDGSKTGHPGYVVSKDDEKNRYLVVRFDSDKFDEITKIDKGIRHITKLSFPTSNNVCNSYVRNRPMLCKRKDIGTPLPNLILSTVDLIIIQKISINEPEMSPSLRKNKKRTDLAYSAKRTGCV